MFAADEAVEPLAVPGTRARGTRGAKTPNRSPSLLPPPTGDESNGDYAGKQPVEQRRSQPQLVDLHPTVGEGKRSGVSFESEAALLAALARQQQQQIRQDDDLHSPLGSVMSPVNGQLSPTVRVVPDRTMSGDSHDVMEEALRPYYRRCIELLLSDLLDCLQSLAYKEGALQEREAAIAKCMCLVASPTLNLSALQTLVNHFGKCVKTKASPTELERHLQEELVEDVLYLSRFLGNTAAKPKDDGNNRREQTAFEGMCQ